MNGGATFSPVSFDRLRGEWTRLGEQDPLWAVFVAPGTRGGKWDVDAFFALGRREVDGALGELAGLGLTPGRTRALDFGCGVGRLSQALADHVDEVIGLDIAPSMLAKARELDQRLHRSGGRIRFVLNETPDLSLIETGSVDVVFSSLVLQHLPPGLARRYLREFVRVLAPAGVAIFQVASGPRLSFKGLIFRLAPWPVLGWAQRRLLGYPAPMRMNRITLDDVRSAIAGTAATLRASIDDDSYGGHWHYTRHYVSVGQVGSSPVAQHLLKSRAEFRGCLPARGMAGGQGQHPPLAGAGGGAPAASGAGDDPAQGRFPADDQDRRRNLGQ
jgi:SAM-dependent methyltransferase